MRSLCLVALCATVALGTELKVPLMPRKISTLERGSLSRYLKELEYDVTERDNGSCYVSVKSEEEGAQARIMDMVWSDHDSLVVRAAWNSPHTGLGDLPILNTWNQKYRFCKVSTQESVGEEPASPSVVIMHLDQFMPVHAGEPAVKDTLKRSVEIFKVSLLAFDKFFTDVYKQVWDWGGGLSILFLSPHVAQQHNTQAQERQRKAKEAEED